MLRRAAKAPSTSPVAPSAKVAGRVTVNGTETPVRGISTTARVISREAKR